MNSTKTVNARRCGPCMACCAVVQVEEIAKPANARCGSMKYGKGCTLYGDEKRPEQCITYSCMWLAGMGKRTDRPDRIDMFFEGATHAKYGFRIMYAYETKTDSSKRGKARGYIQSLRSQVVVVVVSPHGHKKVVGGPPQHIELIRADMQLQVLQNNPPA